jgi:hypothetical protein
MATAQELQDKLDAHDALIDQMGMAVLTEIQQLKDALVGSTDAQAAVNAAVPRLDSMASKMQGFLDAMKSDDPMIP